MNPKKQTRWERELDYKLAVIKDAGFDCGDWETLDMLTNFISNLLKEERKRWVEEVAKQLEMTVLFYEKAINDLADGKTSGVVESLESKIRAFIKYELNSLEKEEE